ncbi:MAG: putative bifunctional diguanylate cyclase/phosphodiesterase [Pseudomonadota bacterium]
MESSNQVADVPQQPLNLLIVEDNRDDAQLLRLQLESYGYDLHWQCAYNAEQFDLALYQQWDLILCDYALPDFSAAVALERLRSRQIATPLLVVSGALSQADAAALMFQGARDFIDKNDLSRLLPAVERELQVCKLRREKSRIEEDIDRITYFDEHSALPNGNHFRQTLAELQQGGEEGPYIVAQLNLPRLGLIADTYGDATAAELTRALAHRLSRISYRASVARLGHNDFALILHCTGHCGSCTSASARIREQFDTPFLINKRELYLSPTIGLSCTPCHSRSPTALLRNARLALQHAQETAQPSQHFTPSIEAQRKQRTIMADRLRGGIAREDFALVYQPKVAARGGAITALEVLLRWEDAQLGKVSPAQFIPVAEETGDIVAIGSWVLRKACEQAVKWRQTGCYSGRIAVNLSMRQLRDPAFAAVVANILEQTGLPARQLELEVTETDIMQDSELSIQTLHQLRELGVYLVIDDFGTGYSSLSYLKKLPIAMLKIDRSFITDIEHSSDSLSIVQAILALAKSLRLDVVAEGVETAEQLEILRRDGCTELQGYHISRPLDEAAIADFIQHYGGE